MLATWSGIGAQQLSDASQALVHKDSYLINAAFPALDRGQWTAPDTLEAAPHRAAAHLQTDSGLEANSPSASLLSKLSNGIGSQASSERHSGSNSDNGAVTSGSHGIEAHHRAASCIVVEAAVRSCCHELVFKK